MAKGIFTATKKDVADKVAEAAGLTKKQAADAVTAAFDAIAETLKDGGEVSISGFGKFEVAERAARQGVNPATGEKIEIAASKAPKFKAAKALKDIVK
ncbi:MAG: HU family DNA-binding protein [Erysipelotrichaceae bacterium]|uniref:HU family DNA-binding protein n=1 Tax=Grylomicrobium aquisgranensis TaxID=2926318 RepID=A0AB35U3F5_9FIRM|nr:HU family DNA-binding protein [Lactimicrobium massiliense]MCH4020882.1 HU family DNA-binding protein [Erysipelotrichaceae bacterium]MCI1326561.1 HU family DNA-binding protein [Solobacterium sp.]MDX8420020.1 HU family DNA-binding protein [Stecheria sp. CLA-KB-P133]MCH4044120.1 HU family DNA-binding protein [Erysipelotrichaceae bacterium]MCH4121335.1 HU family DNA-binding protein [Erysipelotrichaceae bacterium]